MQANNQTKQSTRTSRHPSEDRMNRRGESEMHLGFFFIILIVAIMVIGLFVFIVIAASTHTSQTVLEQQKDYSLYNGAIVQGLYSFVTAQYSDIENTSCALGSNFQRPATITLRFKSQNTPESCSFFVDNSLLRTERRLAPDCTITCGFEEFNRQFSLGEFDYRDKHQIRVCCNGICVERELRSLCH